MPRWLAGLLAALIAVPAGAVPLAIVGHSSEPWESHGDEPGTPSCVRINPGLLHVVPAETRAHAILMLNDKQVRVLRESDGATLFPALVGPGDLASRLLARAIAQRDAQKADAEIRSAGSWSLADQDEVDELRRAQPADLKAVLVRGLAGDVVKDRTFTAQLCRTVVNVRGRADHNLEHPVRAPVVLLVRAVPSGAYVQWDYPDPSSKF